MNFSGFPSTKEIHYLVALGVSLDRINVSLGPLSLGNIDLPWDTPSLLGKENPWSREYLHQFMGPLDFFHLIRSFTA